MGIADVMPLAHSMSKVYFLDLVFYDRRSLIPSSMPQALQVMVRLMG